MLNKFGTEIARDVSTLKLSLALSLFGVVVYFVV